MVILPFSGAQAFSAIPNISGPALDIAGYLKPWTVPSDASILPAATYRSLPYPSSTSPIDCIIVEGDFADHRDAIGNRADASHTPQPQHAAMLASYRPSGVTSKQESGHCSQHSSHLMQVSKFTTVAWCAW